MADREMRVTGKPFSWLWAITAFVTWLVLALCHLKFSIWLVTPRETPLGTLPLSTWVPHVSLVALAVLLVFLVFQLRRSPRPWWTAAFWLLFAAAVAAQDRFLTFSFNEYAHYPQYALVAWLVARAVDPQRNRWPILRVLFWTTLLGAIDEVMQYLWITASYSDYVDFNDWLVNLVSAAAGVLLYYGAAPLPVAQPAAGGKPEWIAIGVVAMVVGLGFATGRLAYQPAGKVPNGGILDTASGPVLYLQRGPAFYGGRQPGPRHGTYYVLRPLEGLGLMIVAALAFGRLRPRMRSQTRV
jgi:hypothetical protein